MPSACPQSLSQEWGYQRQPGPGTMHVYACLIEAGAEGESEEFVFLKCRSHRGRAVITRNVVPSEEPLSGRDEAISKRSAFEIDGEHRAPRHCPEAAKELDHLVVAK